LCLFIFVSMTSLKPSQIAKLHDRLLFEEIHHLKSYFIRLFSDLANEISLDYLQVLHPQSQGIKISKGNELQHCPYQVLDLIRDFDIHMGLNIRVMNWWGRRSEERRVGREGMVSERGDCV